MALDNKSLEERISIGIKQAITSEVETLVKSKINKVKEELDKEIPILVAKVCITASNYYSLHTNNEELHVIVKHKDFINHG